MRNYELGIIVHPDLEKETERIIEKISGFIKDGGGTIIDIENWGRRRLAYPIAKNDFGIYVFINFQTEPKQIQKIEKGIKISEEVIRYLLISAERLSGIQEEKETIREEEERKETPVPSKKEEKERMKKLDEKLKELLGGEDKSES